MYVCTIQYIDTRVRETANIIHTTDSESRWSFQYTIYHVTFVYSDKFYPVNNSTIDHFLTAANAGECSRYNGNWSGLSPRYIGEVVSGSNVILMIVSCDRRLTSMYTRCSFYRYPLNTSYVGFRLSFNRHSPSLSVFHQKTKRNNYGSYRKREI